jgi:putative ABC transport system substrate-binding protein
MKRREFIAGLGAVAAWPLVARAQQPAMPVIGYLGSQSADDENKNFINPFLQGLKDAGYVDGQNVAVEYRWAENQLDRLPALAADLVRRRVAVIIAAGTPAALAAKALTNTIPIVFEIGTDPVALGLVASLNRPGVNVTGITLLSSELAPKRLQLLRELMPNAPPFGVLANPEFPSSQSIVADLLAAAHTLSLQPLLGMREPIATSNRRSPPFRNGMLVRSWSAKVPCTPRARNNSRRWQLAMRCLRSSLGANSPWPAA